MNPDSTAIRNVGTIARCIQAIIDCEFKRFNLEKGQFYFLSRVCENEGISQIDLSTMMKVDKATTTKAIQKMQEKGLIEKKRDMTDKRIWKLYPTQKAMEIYPLLIEEENEDASICFSGLNKDEIAIVSEALEKMKRNINCKWETIKCR